MSDVLVILMKAIAVLVLLPVFFLFLLLGGIGFFEEMYAMSIVHILLADVCLLGMGWIFYGRRKEKEHDEAAVD